MDHTAERAALISGSPSPNSRSRTLLEHAWHRLEAAGFEATLVDLAALPSDALLGRRSDERVAQAVQAVLAASVVVASSPVYRATYSGLLKTFFDLLPQDALAGKIAVPILTGGGPAHLLALDHGFRPLFASVGATVVANGIYGYDAQFKNGPEPALIERVDRAVEEAVALARAGAETALGRP
ncbi:MAG: NAD(P)H-dependent oxidoreductase [Gemmatimonadetes bacterium]|nr:NAD(P)H-dependent oxidoreductase [Gemmatimonadota bacterium]